MIFIVNNNRLQSDNRLYFVKAPPSFEKWFNEVLVPFIMNEEEQIRAPSIIARAERIEWRSENATCTPDELADHLCIAIGDFPTFKT